SIATFSCDKHTRCPHKKLLTEEQMITNLMDRNLNGGGAGGFSVPPFASSPSASSAAGQGSTPASSTRLPNLSLVIPSSFPSISDSAVPDSLNGPSTSLPTPAIPPAQSSAQRQGPHPQHQATSVPLWSSATHDQFSTTNSSSSS